MIGTFNETKLAVTQKTSHSEVRLPTVCVAILNWRGIKYLPSLLSSLLSAVNKYPGECPIVVLDNNEGDDTDRTWIRQNFPTVRVIQAPANDYLYSYNWLLQQLTEQIVILLNNDLKVDENFLLPLVKHFTNPRVFAASSRSYDWEGKQVTSGPYLFRQHRGWFYCTPDLAKQFTCHTLFACGGHMAVDREKFLDIGGFDRLFYPAYGEDIDLGFRAWQKDWISVYEPESIVYHAQSGSWNEDTSDRKAEYMTLRSNFLFQWRNLDRFPFAWLHAVYLPWLRLRKLLDGDRVWLKAYGEAKAIWQQHLISNSNVNFKDRHLSKDLKRICGTKF